MEKKTKCREIYFAYFLEVVKMGVDDLGVDKMGSRRSIRKSRPKRRLTKYFGQDRKYML